MTNSVLIRVLTASMLLFVLVNATGCRAAGESASRQLGRQVSKELSKRAARRISTEVTRRVAAQIARSASRTGIKQEALESILNGRVERAAVEAAEAARSSGAAEAAVENAARMAAERAGEEVSEAILSIARSVRESAEAQVRRIVQSSSSSGVNRSVVEGSVFAESEKAGYALIKRHFSNESADEDIGRKLQEWVEKLANEAAKEAVKKTVETAGSRIRESVSEADQLGALIHPGRSAAGISLRWTIHQAIARVGRSFDELDRVENGVWYTWHLRGAVHRNPDPDLSPDLHVFAGDSGRIGAIQLQSSWFETSTGVSVGDYRQTMLKVASPDSTVEWMSGYAAESDTTLGLGWAYKQLGGVEKITMLWIFEP